MYFSRTIKKERKKMNSFAPQAVYLSLLLLLFTFIYYLCKTCRSNANPLIPPSPPKLPIIGHLHLLTAMPHHTFTLLSNKLGPIFYFHLGQVPTLVINSAALARLVLKTHDHVFSNRPQLISAQYLSFGCSDVTFSPYGPYWRQARKICVTELLSSKRVNSFELVRDEEVDRLLAAVAARSGTEVDVSKLFFSLANDVLCRVAFGKRFMEEEGGGGGGGEVQGQKRKLVDVLTEAQELFSGFSVGDFFPGWKWVDSVSGYKKRVMNNLEDLRVVCDEIIKEHLRKKEKEEEKEDFVDVLLRVQTKDDLEVPITDDNLKALLLVSDNYN